MQALYFSLAAFHIVAVVVTGILWAIFDIRHSASLRPHLRDIRAVHFGSLYLVPWFFGLAYAFEKLHVPAYHQLVFPIGLAALITFSSIAYMMPRSPGVEPFYYWTKGWPMIIASVGLFVLVVAMCWTATILVLYSFA